MQSVLYRWKSINQWWIGSNPISYRSWKHLREFGKIRNLFFFFATSTLLCITVLANKFVGLTEFERLCSCLCLFMFLCLCLCLEAHNRHNDAPAGWHLQLMITIPAVAYEKSSWAAVCCIIIGVGEGQAGGLTTAEGRCSWRARFGHMAPLENTQIHLAEMSGFDSGPPTAVFHYSGGGKCLIYLWRWKWGVLFMR